MNIVAYGMVTGFKCVQNCCGKPFCPCA